MRILFIAPSFGKNLLTQGLTSPTIATAKGKTYAIMPNLTGLIFATLTPEKHTFIYVDEEIEDIDFNLKADLVAISSMSAQSNRAYHIAAKFMARGARVVIGGIHASVMSEEVAEYCDSVVVGQGENIWPVLLEDFEKGELRKFYYAKDFPPVERFVSPKYDACKYDQYYSFPIQATRGCPYSCEFCSIKHSSGHRYLMRPIEDVVSDINKAEKLNGPKGRYDRKGFYFVDDNLYVNREYTKNLFTAMAGLDITWDGQGTMNTASDEEVVKLMANSGCLSFSFGFESINAESLKESNKPKCNVITDYQDVVRNLQKHGIAAGGYFIMGFDGDHVDVFKRTLDFVSDLGIFQAFVSLLTPFQGTELYRRMDGEGRIFEKHGQFYNSWTCTYTPKNMSVRELQAGFRWLNQQLATQEYVKNAMERFWEDMALGNSAKTLKLSERLLLIAISLFKLHSKAHKAQRDFLYWAAFHPNARNMRMILWSMLRCELVDRLHVRESFDPAEHRRLEALEAEAENKAENKAMANPA
ncbi:MAG: B12-binding domain-containing radical SAM protein [Clostridiales Family XIII bacterium]|jgi:radical SAM superfamily enzyme YgiQ (UPF0313 family)|nr:B12-binding domain-containing radical SAM protein [Clostridiales Family XIII bacterium]